MLAADQRDAFAEARPVPLDQPGAMAVLLLRHLVEHFGGLRKLLAQPVGIGAVDAPVVFLRGNRQRQDFLFGQRVERTAAETEDAG